MLEGELLVTVGEQQMKLPAGSAAFPRAHPHTFKVTSPQAKGLILISPAGFENFIRMSEIAPGAPDAAALKAMVEIAGEFGVRFRSSNRQTRAGVWYFFGG